MAELPIPTDWDGTSTCRWSVCWPDSVLWKAILYGLIELPYRGRFWDASTGSILGVKESFRQIYDANFELSEVIMACGDSGLQDVAAAINALARATATSNSTASATADCGCGGGNNGFAQSYQDDGGGNFFPVYGGEPSLSVPAGEFPPGYSDLPTYDQDKCNLAGAIVDGWISTLRYLGALATFDFIALAGLIVAGIASIIVFPPAAIPVMMTLLAVLGTGLAIITQLATGISNNRADIVCILYEGESTQDIITAYAAALDVIIAAIPASGPIALALKSIALLLANTDTLNRLMTGQGASGLATENCATCGATGEFTWDLGSGDLTVNGEWRTVTAQVFPNNVSYVRFHSTTTCFDVEIEFRNPIGLSGALVWELDLYRCNQTQEAVGLVQLNSPRIGGKGLSYDFISVADNLTNTNGFTVEMRLAYV